MNLQFLKWEQLNEWMQIGLDWFKELSALIKVPILLFLAIILILGIFSFVKKSFKLFLALAIILIIVVIVFSLI